MSSVAVILKRVSARRIGTFPSSERRASRASIWPAASDRCRHSAYPLMSYACNFVPPIGVLLLSYGLNLLYCSNSELLARRSYRSRFAKRTPSICAGCLAPIKLATKIQEACRTAHIALMMCRFSLGTPIRKWMQFSKTTGNLRFFDKNSF